ncbi:Phthiotriol/phenolphthiotriol dimycocerosates methyltransferase [Lacunisphaera limnophila]|uniref:Phthiotriol/phenolphthiotriol dimycocerosates methyltransferase n=1 Tax=Lacunisphaera limnophila TaxID=1838286 RepID=A0A1D8AU98_9BACT|nr:class I SAM-dependent methyltransferase [Lacunisphaera limnophila]AOS44475.1 Phthiotriol/phenolphthiotriol dimycocerosates methyltransferase [Lacunisphaera limnophila]
MLIRLAVFLLESSPLMRRLLWRWWYGRLAQRRQGADWTFMNYGFVPPAGAAALALDPSDETDRLCIQLYHRVASATNLAGKTLLEVGSGRGGGASFVARYHRPAQITGADFSAQAVALCQKRHAAVAKLSFVVGDAEHLPFPDASFDAVLNVESSHCYGHIEKFFAEAARVLRPGGWFLYTDFRAATDVPAWHAALAAQSDWEQVALEDITAAVTAALEADDARKRKLIDDFIPPAFHHLFGEFAGLVGGQMHTGFRTRQILYHRFAFRKK